MIEHDFFVRGDRVKHKSGGPIMAVEEVSDYQLMGWACKCKWFDRHHMVQTEYFVIESIEKVLDLPASKEPKNSFVQNALCSRPI